MPPVVSEDEFLVAMWSAMVRSLEAWERDRARILLGDERLRALSALVNKAEEGRPYRWLYK